MNKLTQRFLAVSAAALLAGASVTAMARGPGDCDERHSGPHTEKMQQRMADRLAKREADLKAALKLTAAQEAAWSNFTSAMKPPAMDSKNRPSREEMAKLTTPQRMDKMQAIKAERDAHMAQRMEATKAFYAILTPEQQKVFDQQAHSKGRHGDRGHGEQDKHHG